MIATLMLICFHIFPELIIIIIISVFIMLVVVSVGGLALELGDDRHHIVHGGIGEL